ncbi:MAG: tetratricopeptide repeat protein [Bryobacteraceae bacterium]|nr:tetratricopeptide repeat protein [Bryobacteraceae bacterium]
MRMVCLSLLLALPALAGEPRLLSFAAGGALLADAPAVFRSGGLALAPLEALYAAERAMVQDGDGRLHPVLWVTGEDMDAGVVEVWVGAQAPVGPDVSSFGSEKMQVSGQAAQMSQAKESGAFGLIARLEGLPAPGTSGPLHDEHGLFAGWHATRMVNGQSISFAVPPERLDQMSRTIRQTIAEWNSRHDSKKEAPYLRALGYLWAEDFDGALFYFRQSAEADSSNARAWMHLGFVEGKVGSAASRMDCYRKAIEIDPSLAEAHYLLGFSLLMSGDHDGAFRELRALRKLDPAFAKRLEIFMKSVHVDVLGEDGKIRHRTQRRL